MRQSNTRAHPLPTWPWGLVLSFVGTCVLSGGLARGAQPVARTSAKAKAHRKVPSWQAPDPKPLRSKHQVILDLGYHNGKVKVLRIHQVELKRPRLTPRMMGRFAVELLTGPVVIERLRFNFPLLGADGAVPHKRLINEPVRFDRNVNVSVRVSLPLCPRANHARVVDRATGKIWTLRWPPIDNRSQVVSKRVRGHRALRPPTTHSPPPHGHTPQRRTSHTPGRSSSNHPTKTQPATSHRARSKPVPRKSSANE